ncbi:MAG: CDP-glycerol glycerophosphotransferase family protein [Candidatus Competibacteraceae bacterium]|nr:CDP-glycerol glycerophosphotransferase family protein [Candidatus Competibacteraceae bacterium]
MAQEPNVFLIDPPGQDLVPFLKAADLMISDCSSAAFQFLALDRPLILINNPQRFTTPECFDEQGIEWQWRDMATQVNNIQQLHSAIQAALDTPETNGSVRRCYRERLFGHYTDGNAVQRVAAHLRTLAAEITP